MMIKSGKVSSIVWTQLKCDIGR